MKRKLDKKGRKEKSSRGLSKVGKNDLCDVCVCVCVCVCVFEIEVGAGAK